MRRLLALLIGALALSLAMPVAAQQQPGAADRLVDAAKAAMVDDPGRALALAQQAQRAVDAIGEPRRRATVEATALWLQSEALIRTRRSDQASATITRALKLISSDPLPTKLRGDLLLARAGVQEADMRYAESLASLQDAYRIFVATGERRSQAIALQMIATLYTQAKDFQSANKYLKQAVEAYTADPRLQISIRNLRGNALLEAEQPKQAEAEYRKAVALAREADAPNFLPLLLANVARALLDQRRFADAEAVIAETRALVQHDPSHRGEANILSIAAQSAFAQKQYDRAADLIQRSFAGIDLSQTRFAQLDAHFTAYSIFRARGQTAQALAHLERARTLGNEATELATSTSTALMAARFDYANQELRIANYQAEEARREAAFQRTLFLSLGGAALVVVILLSIALFTIRRSRDQVRRANTVLGETNAALEKALKAKTEFLATTSHEIRTPLNGILGMTQIMLRDANVSAETRDRIGVVHGAGMTMRALVDDILDVAKMETGNLTVDMTATDLHAALADVTRMWAEQSRAKGLDFTLDCAGTPRWIETDPGRLRQILFNLLSNAVKFTATGGLSVRVSAQGDRLKLAVRDTGIGIPADKLDEVFESFKQVDAGTTRQFGGTGLGLSIVRNLAHALGGTVSVTSVMGEGSTFTVDLPLRPVAAPDSAAETESGGDRIVVLDRNPIVRGMIRALLGPHFAAIQFAASVEEAAALVRDAAPALVLADQASLAADAGDAVEKLRELVAATPVAGAVAVLWNGVDATVSAALNDTGVGLILAKPIKGPDLIAEMLRMHNEICVAPRRTMLVSQAA